MKSSIKNFFSKCDQIRRKLQIWSHLLKKSVMENFIFCAVLVITIQAYFEPFHTYKVDCLAKPVDDWKPITTFLKDTILVAWQGLDNTSAAA